MSLILTVRTGARSVLMRQRNGKCVVVVKLLSQL
jgi:hypothetical protein